MLVAGGWWLGKPYNRAFTRGKYARLASLVGKPYNRAFGAREKRPPFGGFTTTFPPLKRWDYGC